MKDGNKAFEGLIINIRYPTAWHRLLRVTADEIMDRPLDERWNILKYDVDDLVSLRKGEVDENEFLGPVHAKIKRQLDIARCMAKLGLQTRYWRK